MTASSGSLKGGAAVVVAIPVRDEAERIGPCLAALADQVVASPDAVVVLVNNTRDESAAIARAAAPGLPFLLDVVEHDFAAGAAGAGLARRAAMERGAVLAGEGGILLTTDADGRVASDWLAANLAQLAMGADVVAGRAEIDPVEAALIPDRLHEDNARECAYAAVLDEIVALLDPDPWNPLPRHTEHSGASIAVRAAIYRRVGGMPALPTGEDRRFFELLRRVDARIRQALEVRVVVSGRIEGRAPGGMADTIRRRLDQPDRWLDEALESTAMTLRRADLRARARRLHAAGNASERTVGLLARQLGLTPDAIEPALAGPAFGAGWALIEAASPALRRERVPVARLPAEMARALREREALRDAMKHERLPDLAAASV